MLTKEEVLTCLNCYKELNLNMRRLVSKSISREEFPDLEYIRVDSWRMIDGERVLLGYFCSGSASDKTIVDSLVVDIEDLMDAH